MENNGKTFYSILIILIQNKSQLYVGTFYVLKTFVRFEGQDVWTVKSIRKHKKKDFWIWLDLFFFYVGRKKVGFQRIGKNWNCKMVILFLFVKHNGISETLVKTTVYFFSFEPNRMSSCVSGSKIFLVHFCKLCSLPVAIFGRKWLFWLPRWVIFDPGRVG